MVVKLIHIARLFLFHLDNRGEGDLHDRDYTEYQESIVLTADELFSPASAKYILTLYPNKDLFAVFSTPGPIVACIGSVLIILFTSLLFFGYDSCVRKEFNAKTDLLAAKRQFVRFVSHEVRTPLNSVCMGLSLMQEEIAHALGVEVEGDTYASSKRPRKKPEETKLITKESAADWFGLTQETLQNAQSAVDVSWAVPRSRSHGECVSLHLISIPSHLIAPSIFPSGIKRDLQVLSDLLNYDKVESGTLSLETTVIPIWSLVESTTMEFRVPTAQKEIKLSLEYATDPDPDPERNAPMGKIHKNLSLDIKERRVVGDSVRITQVLRNLISNAMKFAPHGGMFVIS